MDRTNPRSPHTGIASGFINCATLFGVCALLLVTYAVSPVLAHDNPGYWHGASPVGHNPDWMAEIPSSKRISELSIPGTHETMARFGGDGIECQSMSLAQQLDSGIRAFDIRLRHLNNSFTVHHGAAYQNATFGNNASRVFEIAPGIVVAMDALTI